MKLPRNVSGARLQASLRRLGYETVRQRGSHSPSDLIRAVIDCPYMFNIQGFGCPAGT